MHIIRCPACRKILFDGQVIKARAVRLADPAGVPLPQGEALCRCKRWVPMPVRWTG